MIEVETIIIDDIKYMILNEVNNYVYLANVNNPRDFLIQKRVEINGEKYLEPLKDREEFNKALELLSK